MRFWPFRRSARMAVGTGESNVNNILSFLDGAYAGSEPASVTQTAAVETALGMVGRAFMLAEPRPRMPALTPLMLSMIARQLLVDGNALFEIRVNRTTGDIQLIPVGEYEIAGDVAPETWQYRIDQEKPNGDRVRRVVPYKGMVHVRYMPRPAAPWAGIAPLVAAGMSATQYAKIEKSLDMDAAPPSGLLLATPDGANQGIIDQAAAALNTGRGGISLMQTTAGGFGQGTQAAPKQDWDQKRFGPMVPTASVDLREKTALWILDALGVPATLHTSQGGAQREAYRHLFTATIVPLGALIASELSEKLERSIRFAFPVEFESDISARTRGFKSLVEVGVKPVVAAAKVKLELTEADIEEPEPPPAPPAAPVAPPPPPPA